MQTTAVKKRHQDADVVVVGTGGGALTAAMMAHDNGARVVVVEKGDKVGGTTAISGGGIWIPLNDHMAEVGATDSREDALTYCKFMTDGKAPDKMVEAFVDAGHEMVRYLEQHTPLKMKATHMPDYHAEQPGGRTCGPVWMQIMTFGYLAGIHAAEEARAARETS